MANEYPSSAENPTSAAESAGAFTTLKAKAHDVGAKAAQRPTRRGSVRPPVWIRSPATCTMGATGLPAPPTAPRMPFHTVPGTCVTTTSKP